jgi:hypothetical protein
MKSARAATPETAAAEPPAQPNTTAEGGPETETMGEPAAEPSKAAATAPERPEDGEDSEAPAPDVPTSPEAAAGAAVRAVRQAKAQKGGKKFRVFLLLLCLGVIALFLAGVITGRIGLGGLLPRPQAPSTGDVAPPASDVPQQER